MRKLVIAALLLTVSLAACGSDDKPKVATGTTGGDSAQTTAAAAPVSLSGKVTDKGTKDATSASELELEADNFYFNPTFIKVKAGQKLTLQLKNEGSAPHTFTSTELGVDKELKPGDTATIDITVPSADAVAFFCRFHQGGGMQGALFTKEGATAGGGSSGSTATTVAPSNGY
jgi:plastocyanin